MFKDSVLNMISMTFCTSYLPVNKNENIQNSIKYVKKIDK